MMKSRKVLMAIEIETDIPIRSLRRVAEMVEQTRLGDLKVIQTWSTLCDIESKVEGKGHTTIKEG